MVNENEILDAVKELQERRALIGGCSNHGCVVNPPKGLGTNAGCKCWQDAHKMQRFAFAMNTFAKRVERACA